MRVAPFGSAEDGKWPQELVDDRRCAVEKFVELSVAVSGKHSLRGPNLLHDALTAFDLNVYLCVARTHPAIGACLTQKSLTTATATYRREPKLLSELPSAS